MRRITVPGQPGQKCSLDPISTAGHICHLSKVRSLKIRGWLGQKEKPYLQNN
jgi:hypothetical protein